MEQLTGSKLGKESDKAVYCHPVYLTYVQGVCMLSHFSSVQLFATPWTVACQAPLSASFSRQEYWSALPCPPPLYAEYIMQNARLDESQAGIKIAGRTINNLGYADDTTLMAEIKEEIKSLLMKVKKESQKLA